VQAADAVVGGVWLLGVGGGGLRFTMLTLRTKEVLLRLGFSNILVPNVRRDER
jgi:hypothetical protein